MSCIIKHFGDIRLNVNLIYYIWSWVIKNNKKKIDNALCNCIDTVECTLYECERR